MIVYLVYEKDSRISLKNNHLRLIVVLLYEPPEGYLGSMLLYESHRRNI